MCTEADYTGNSSILIGMVSLGCPKNLVDGESMLGLLSERGYQITPDAGKADLIIVNTCGFIDAAKKESIAAILDMADKKTTGRCAALIVTGCLSERYRESFAAELPEVDAVLGAGEYGRICEVVDYFAAKIGRGGGGARDNNATADPMPQASGESPFYTRTVRESTAVQRLEHLNAPRILTSDAGYVYIKIAEGCDNHCAYCVIPSIRGSYISRPADDILAEAERLSSSRDIEAVLVAQDTTNYGAEAGRAGEGTGALCDLLERLSRIERVKWIRLMYAYPDRIDDQLAEQFSKNRKLLRYLDMPIQHASDNVLRRMGRRYSRSDLYDLVDRLRRAAPGIILRTTVMTGFPGERENDFSDLMNFLSEAKFERLGVFAYSREEGTPAARMDGRTPKKTALWRRSELLRAQAAILSAADASRIGSEYEAIIESGSNFNRGGVVCRVRTYAEAPEVDGNIRIMETARRGLGNSRRGLETTLRGGKQKQFAPGTFVNIRVSGKDNRGLLGELLT